jgi:CheY-like chemotaxis protein
MKILICVANPVVALDLWWLLHQQGHLICGTARNSGQGLEKDARTHPDLVIVDLDLSDGATGFDLVERLERSGFPSMILAGDPQSVAPSTAARAVLRKPFSEGHLAMAMAKVARSAGPGALPA